MKKVSVSRLKKLPLLLGTLLIVSVVAYGTRAYFSDSATQQADIELTLGNLDIESENSTWKYTSTGKDFNTALLAGTTSVATDPYITVENAKSITNVQPGDQFERIFKFSNIGSLEQLVTVDNTVSSTEDSIFKVDFKRIEENGDLTTDLQSVKIKTGDFVRYKMIISVKTDNTFDKTHNQKIGKDITNDLIFNALQNNDSTSTVIKNAVTVTADQVGNK